MPLSSAQKGAIGQFTFLATALVTGRGQVEVYTPAADNEGRDAEVRRHLKPTGPIGIQVKVALSKTSNGAGRNNYLGLRFRLRKQRIQNDPRLWYFFAVYDALQLRFDEPTFLVPSRMFHKLARQETSGGLVWFRMTANLAPGSHDEWTPYRVASRDLGRRLLQIVDEAGLTTADRPRLLPHDAVWLGRAIRGAAKKSLRVAPAGGTYQLIRGAVLERNSLSAWYKGHRRLFSPFLLGTKAGDPHVLGYQFDGTSEKPAPNGSSESWRCLKVAELTRVKVLPGVWHSVPMGKGFQHCIDQVDVSAYRPAPTRRQLRAA